MKIYRQVYRRTKSVSRKRVGYKFSSKLYVLILKLVKIIIIKHWAMRKPNHPGKRVMAGLIRTFFGDW